MKFLCLGYLSPEKMESLSKEEIDTIMSECTPHLEKLYKCEQLVFDSGLEVKSKYMQRVNGKVMVTDGPFTETKEIVGGVFLLEAQNMEEAIRIASLHPTTQVPAGEHFGWRLEIRPLHTFVNHSL